MWNFIFNSIKCNIYNNIKFSESILDSNDLNLLNTKQNIILNLDDSIQNNYNNTTNIWHKSFCHLSTESLNLLINNNIIKVNVDIKKLCKFVI